MSVRGVPDQSVISSATWRYLGAHRVARLASVDEHGRPHVVPVCFAVDDLAIYIPLDEKRKRVSPERLRRVRNLLAHPDVTFLVDDFFEDWSRLAYVMVRGLAGVVTPGDDQHARAIQLLREKYPQYASMSIESRPVIRIVPYSSYGWSPGDDVSDRDGTTPARYLDFDAVIRGRRSVRAFRSDPVPRELVERVLEAARWAPSPHGRMPWRFAVVTRSDLKEKLADAMGDEWERQLSLDGEPPEIIEKRKLRSRQRILDAPVCIVLCLYVADLDRYPDVARQEAERTMAVQSLGAAAQNLLLATYQLGLDGGWMCAPLFCSDTVRSALDLAPDLEPHALLTLGYAARDPVRRDRLPLESLIARFD